MFGISHRLLKLALPTGRSAFLWGPRKVGKSYWTRSTFPAARLIDLLKSDVFADYATRPSLLRERLLGQEGLVIIDEVQRIPALLDEVHWLIENAGVSFILTGSSARKLRRGHANLLGGRAWRRVMHPLSLSEVTGVDTIDDLERVCVSGLLPPHFLSPDPREDLRAYVADYLREEVAAEALTRNLPAFSDFLRVAAITSSELLNYSNLARECGVSAKVVRTYVEILEDTFLAFRIQPWSRATQRRLIETEKLYLFDVGVTSFLARRRPAQGTPEFGKSFEQIVLGELLAWQAYRSPDTDIRFFRTATGREVDFLVNDGALAIEVKAARRVHDAELACFRVLDDEVTTKRQVVVCLEPERRRVGRVDVLPLWDFVRALWAGELVDA